MPAPQQTADPGRNPHARGAGSNTHLAFMVPDRLVDLGTEIFTLAPREFGGFLKSEVERWRSIVAKHRIPLKLYPGALAARALRAG